MKIRCSLAVHLSLFLMLIPFTALSAPPEFTLRIKDHLFYPTEMKVPADIKFKLIIENQDNAPEEFDSFDLNREKVIFGGRKATLFIGPLEAGEYQYFGEYNPNTARGKIIAVDAKDLPAQDNTAGGKDVN